MIIVAFVLPRTLLAFAPPHRPSAFEAAPASSLLTLATDSQTTCQLNTFSDRKDRQQRQRHSPSIFSFFPERPRKNHRNKPKEKSPVTAKTTTDSDKAMPNRTHKNQTKTTRTRKKTFSPLSFFVASLYFLADAGVFFLPERERDLPRDAGVDALASSGCQTNHLT